MLTRMSWANSRWVNPVCSRTAFTSGGATLNRHQADAGTHLPPEDFEAQWQAGAARGLLREIPAESTDTERKLAST